MHNIIIANQKEWSKRSGFKMRFLEREKQKIASELHDDVASKLSIIRLRLCEDPKRNDDIISLLDNAIHSVRHISHDLHKPFFKQISFLDAVRDFVLPLNDVIKVDIRCICQPSYRLKQKTKLNLFRIVQEVIHNILKHAQASCISIKLNATDTLFQLTIVDNGRGFLNKSIDKIGIGMETIKYRAKEIKANYKFISAKNKGTTFLISLPITNSSL